MPSHRKPQPRVPPILVVLAVVAVAASLTYFVTDRLGRGGDGDQAADVNPGASPRAAGDDEATTAEEETTTTTTPPFDGWVDPALVWSALRRPGAGPHHLPGQPHPHLLRRGSGAPRPRRWRGRSPTSAMCAQSSDGERDAHVVRHRLDRSAVGVRARRPHVGRLRRLRPQRPLPRRRDRRSGSSPDFPTGDIIKGSVTVDPDGFPLVYTGSRDNYLRVIAFDRPAARPSCGSSRPTPCRPTMWNDDWDGSPLIIDDYLFEGGENSQFHIVKLNRGYGADGKCHRRPGARLQHAGLGRRAARRPSATRTVSIENSVAISATPSTSPTPAGWCRGGTSAGSRTARRRPRCSGSGPATTPTRRSSSTTRASSTSASEYERGNDRSNEVGQMMKLDPAQARRTRSCGRSTTTRSDPGGIWATPALYDDVVIVGHQRRRGARRRPGHRARSAGGCTLPGPDVAVTGRRRRRPHPGRLRRASCTPTTCRTPRSTRPSSGSSSSAAASSRRPRCGGAGSTSAPEVGSLLRRHRRSAVGP